MMAKSPGQPLRFFALLMIGWTAVRVAAHYGPPGIPLPTVHRPAPVIAAARLSPSVTAIQSPSPSPLRPKAAALIKAPRFPLLTATRAAPSPRPFHTFDQGAAAKLLASIHFTASFANRHFASDDMGSAPTAIARPISLPPSQKNAHGDRWRGSAWLLWRPGQASPSDVAPVGRLGGSQAGLRLDYALAPASPLRPAAYARLTSALERPTAPEGAIGLAIQPFPALPIGFAVERRIKLGDGARNAMALLAVGGFGPTRIAPGIDAEAYAQAGMVGFHRQDAFIDGKLSLLSPVADTPFRIGASISGGAQPNVERLDIGPELQVRLPLPQTAARLSIEWRERIAGKAAPRSGLTVTLAADF